MDDIRYYGAWDYMHPPKVSWFHCTAVDVLQWLVAAMVVAMAAMLFISYGHWLLEPWDRPAELVSPVGP